MSSTQELLAMVAAAKAAEEEQRVKMEQRRQEIVLRPFQRELGTAASITTVSSVSASSTPNESADNIARSSSPPEPKPSDVALAVTSRPATLSGVLLSSPAESDEALASLRLECNRRTTENTALSNRVQQLERQLAQLEQIAQEKHMEVQRLTASHEEEIGDLQRRLEEAEAAATKAKDPKQCVREGILISKDELTSVRNDMELQERVVRVLEKENEQLIAEKKQFLTRLKTLESGFAHAEARSAFQSVSAGASLNTSSHHHDTAAVSADVVHKQMQDMRIQLQRAQTAELELRLELDQAKKEKREAERRAAAADGNKVEAAELEARALRVQLKRKDDEHAEMVKDMARKISWYVEHQEFNRVQEDMIKEQQETIQQLRLKLLEADSLVTKAGVARTDKDKQIRQLQKHVAELEEVIREKNPNSIAQLIRSCQPPIQHSAIFREMEERIKKMALELEERDRQAQSAMDRLRVESDRIRAQYHSRLEKLEEEMKVRVLNAQTRKVKELEKQLQDARKYYSEKAKEQDATISLLRRGIAPPSASTAVGAASSKSEAAEGSSSSQHPARSGRQNRSRHNSSSSMERCSVESQTEISGVHSPFPTASNVTTVLSHAVPSTASPTFASTVIALQQENVLLKQQLEAMAQTALSSVATSPSGGGAASFQLAMTLQQQLQQLHGEVALHKRLLAEAQEASRTQSNSHEDRILRLRQEHQRDLQFHKDQHDEEMRRCEERHQAELRLALDRADAILQHTKDDMTHFDTATGMPSNKKRSGVHGASPAVQEYLKLVSERLQLLEHRQAVKELDARKEIDDIRKVAQFEAAVHKQKFDLMIEQKNHEIERFRVELDTLLGDLAQLQMTQVR